MRLLVLSFLLSACAACGARTAEFSCPSLPAHLAVKWESSRSSEYWRCQAKSQTGEILLSTFSAEHPGVPTFGFNFRAISHTNGRAIAWFSDRDERGESKNIARAFFPSGNGELPVMMVWFEFKDVDDFKRKADLAAQLELSQ